MRASPAQPPVTLCQRQPRGLRHPPLQKKNTLTKKEIQEFIGQRSKMSDALRHGEFFFFGVGGIISHPLIFRVKWTAISGRIIV